MAMEDSHSPGVGRIVIYEVTAVTIPPIIIILSWVQISFTDKGSEMSFPALQLLVVAAILIKVADLLHFPGEVSTKQYTLRLAVVLIVLTMVIVMTKSWIFKSIKNFFYTSTDMDVLSIGSVTVSVANDDPNSWKYTMRAYWGMVAILCILRFFEYLYSITHRVVDYGFSGAFRSH